MSNLSPSLILEKLKEYQHLKNWFPFVESVNPLLRISQYCDILEIDYSLPILSYFNVINQFQIIRYWSYNSEEHSYFLMFKTFNHNKFFDNIKNAGFIITTNPESVTDSGCLLTFYIKFKKSRYTSLIDFVYKHVCKEFCSSLQNFIGSVKMHKYNLINNGEEGSSENSTANSETVDSYKYLIHYFLNVELDDKPLQEDIENTNNAIFKKQVRKYTEIENDNIPQIKCFLEIKNSMNSKYGEGQFSDNEIARYVVGFQADQGEILSHLDDLVNFRKTLIKSEDEIFNTKNIDNIYNNIVSVLGLDIHKRPVIIFRLAYINKNTLNQIKFNERTLKYILTVFNRAIEQMTSEVDKYVVIVDVKNGSLGALVSNESAFFKKLFNIFNRFYVERLSDLYIINKGILFSTLWNNISQLIESKSVINKITISNNYRSDLSFILTKEQLDLI